MSELDEAFDRLQAAGFELPNGFVNHGPMACEALAALGCADEIEPWARRFARSGGTAVDPVWYDDFDPKASLGEPQALPAWIGYFDRRIDEDGWRAVVGDWVPTLMPSLPVALFHCAIRAAHAVRAINAVDTPARRAELARALGYWAARFEPGQPILIDEPVLDGEVVEDIKVAVTEAAATGARHFVARPNIVALHGVTSAMAVAILVDHLSPTAAAAGLAQVRAEHAALYRSVPAATEREPVGAADDQLARMAAASGDPHQVKLVEACRRGSLLTGEPGFAVAAEVVVGMPSG